MSLKTEIRELLLDKLALQYSKYENYEVTYNHMSEALFYSTIDDLCTKNMPAHFTGFLKKNPEAFEIPDKDTIINSLIDTKLEVAVTPKGNADAPVDGKYFAKPFITEMTLRSLLEKFDDNSDSDSNRQYYFQSQNDNLQHIVELGCPIPRKLPISENTRLFGFQNAANLWIGNKGTTSRLHSDNFDNIYVQVSGVKRIHLIPPCYSSELEEKMLIPCTYNESMELIEDTDTRPVLFPTLDPETLEDERKLAAFPMVVVDLYPGDVLFLPALWYHQITILGPDVNISLNYWHKPFEDEVRWADWNFCRQIGQLIK